MSADFSTRPRPEAGLHLTRLLLVAGTVLLGGAVAHAVWAMAAREASRQDLARERRETEAQRTRLHAGERARGGGSSLRRQAELTASAAPPRVIADLAPLVPAGARLKQVALEYGESLEIELRVEARTPADYDRLLEAMSGSARLTGLLPGAESREGAVDSSVKAVYRPRGAP